MKKRAFFPLLTAGLCLASILSGCDDRPKGVLSDSEMESLLTDLILADAIYNSSEGHKLPDSVRNSLSEAVLRLHGVDRATLDSTYSWYGRNLDEYYKLYANVDKRLQKLRKQSGGGTQKVDENDIWALPKHLVLSPSSYGNSFTFKLPGDMLAGGEELRWKMKMNGFSSVNVLLGIDYADGTSSINKREFQGGNVDIAVIADTANQARRIFGYLVTDRKNMPIIVDSIALVKNPYDSLSYSSFNSQKLITPPAKRKTMENKDSAENTVHKSGMIIDNGQ